MKNFEFSLHEKDEEVLMYFRRHTVTNIPWMVLIAILAFVPVFSFPILPQNLVPFEVLILSLALWYIFVFGAGLGFYLHWFFNIYILTNKRIIDIDYDGLLFHKISSAPLTQIQDITHDVHGPFELIFNFGDVYIQTASESVGEFDFRHVFDPEMVHRKISEAVEESQKQR